MVTDVDTEWMDLGPADLDEGDVKLRKTAAGARLVVLRSAGALQVLDDRCPHEGYPLSQGQLKDGVLTCAWHNWKFDACSGACRTGGDAVRRYPSRVRDGRLEVDVALDVEAEAARLREGIATGLFEDDPSRALRDALRLAELPGHALDDAFTVLARDAAIRGPWGFGHELAALTDLLAWIDEGDIAPAEGFGLAATWVGERLAREPARPLAPAASPSAALSDLLEAEDLEAAEGAVRARVESEGIDAATQAMLPYAARTLLGYGHGTIYLAKGRALSHRLPGAADAIMASVARNLVWSTRETRLPPWAATRRAQSNLPDALGEAPLADRDAYEAEVLQGERPAAQGTVARIADGVDPRALLRAAAHAASVRLERFDPAHAHRVDLDASILDVSHLVTFAEAALDLAPLAGPLDRAHLAVLAAAFVGKLAAADRAPRDPEAPPSAPASLTAAVAARDPEAARAAVAVLALGEIPNTLSGLRPFAAHDAFIRPIFAIHAVKGLEALRRLHRDDPDADRTYLQAYLQLAVPRWPERNVRRVAATAQRFLTDGRPPEGLY